MSVGLNAHGCVRTFCFGALSLGIVLGVACCGSINAALGAMKESSYDAPDLDPKLVRSPKPGQSFACDPVANANVIDNRLKGRATVWTEQTASKVAIQVSDNGRQLFLSREMDVSAGIAQPEKFTITLNGNYYMTAEERLTLGLASIIFDVHTMKMVWSFNGQGMLGIKGESILFQCH